MCLGLLFLSFRLKYSCVYCNLNLKAYIFIAIGWVKWAFYCSVKKNSYAQLLQKRTGSNAQTYLERICRLP